MLQAKTALSLGSLDGRGLLVASSGIEPESGASETLILSIVLRGHRSFGRKDKRPWRIIGSKDESLLQIRRSFDYVI